MSTHSSNNNPSQIASYFLTEIKACQSRIRADRGTENGHGMMSFLKGDHTFAENILNHPMEMKHLKALPRRWLGILATSTKTGGRRPFHV